MKKPLVVATSRLPARVQALLDSRPRARAAFDKQAEVVAAGKRIRALREATKLTQKELAKLVGTSQAHISDLERGIGARGPSLPVMARIERACRTDTIIDSLPAPIPDDGSEPSVIDLVKRVVGTFGTGKLDAMADALQTEASASAVAVAVSSLITEDFPANFMQGISNSDPASAAAMLGVVQKISQCSFQPVQNDKELRQVLTSRRSSRKKAVLALM